MKRIRSDLYREKQRNFKKNKYKNRRSLAIDKLGGKCVKCDCSEMLNFDHIDPKTKSFPISRAPSDKLFWNELNKCQLLCNNCHREKSNKESQGENCYNAKLKECDVKEILSLIKAGVPQIEIARKYKIGAMQISRIKNGTRWRYLTNDC